MRSGVERWTAACGLVVLAAGTAGLTVACVDLFHSTSFDLCESNGDAPGCADAGALDATLRDGGGRDGGQDARVNGDSHVGRDAGDGGPAKADAGGHDAGGDGGGAIDSGPPPMDAGTDFCTFSSAQAAAYAQKACLWLGACVSNADLNEYGKCYPLALEAYDCTLNPNQRVREGALHTFWDGLWHAGSCADVEKANGVPPSCTPSITGCTSARDGGATDLVVACTDGGNRYAKLVNCEMAGYTCNIGACTNSPLSCSGGASGGCNGNVLHSCQHVEIDSGTATAYVDIGRDCTNFGAGSCFSQGSIAGCLPGNSVSTCDASTSVTCTGDATAAGCATGHPETIQCEHFGLGSTCYPPGGGWASSGRDLAGACFNGSVIGIPVTVGCEGANVDDNGGPSGALSVDCPDAGFGGCTISATGAPYCPIP